MPHGFRIFFCLVAALCFSGAVRAQDHGLYDELLRDRVRDGQVDYAALKRDSRLDAYLTAMAEVDLDALPRDQRLAYWINTYNAVTLKLMADAWPVESIMKLNGGKPWDIPLFQPRGASEPITLNHLEHKIIRKQFGEPRIHFALVCAAVSCPPLINEAYVAEKLEAQLHAQTRSFLRNPARNVYDRGQNILRLSPLFQWYAVDFGGEAGVPAFVSSYLTPADQRALKKASHPPAVVFGDYDWNPNAQK